MKKVLFLALLGLSCAHAQTWTVEGPFKDELLGCTRISSGQVQCAMKSSYTGSGPTYFGATYYASDSAAYAPDNKRYIASSSSIGGRDVTRSNVNVSKAAPVTVVYTFDYPKNFDTIALLFLDTGMLKNVPIKNDTTTPTQVVPPTATPATQPAAQTSAAQTSAQTPNLSAFDIKLTDCTANGQGGYTCKQADLIPRP